MTTASEVKKCAQHHDACRPFDRHTQPLRASNEVMAAVQAKAEAMGLSRNEGVEAAMEEWVGWREPGEKWKGPRRQAPGQRKRPGDRNYVAPAPGAVPFRSPEVKP